MLSLPEQVKDESRGRKAKCTDYKMPTISLKVLLQSHEVKNIGGG